MVNLFKVGEHCRSKVNTILNDSDVGQVVDSVVEGYRFESCRRIKLHVNAEPSYLDKPVGDGLSSHHSMIGRVQSHTDGDRRCRDW